MWLKSCFTAHFKLLIVYYMGCSEWVNKGVISDAVIKFSWTVNNTSLSGLTSAVQLQMYSRTNPIKHNVTTDDVVEINVFGSFDWWLTKHWSGFHFFRLCVLDHLIHQCLKRAQTSLTLTGLYHAKPARETGQKFTTWQLPNDFLLSSFRNIPLTNLLLDTPAAAHRFWPFSVLHGVNPPNETNIHSWMRKKERLDREEDREKVWGRSCSMKGNLSNAAQMGLWEALFKGSCPSPHTTAGLHDQCGLPFRTKSSRDRFLKQSWNKRVKGTRVKHQYGWFADRKNSLAVFLIMSVVPSCNCLIVGICCFSLSYMVGNQISLGADGPIKQ